jgi:hypothetical protein
MLGLLVVGIATGLAAAAFRAVGGALGVILVVTAAGAGAALAFLGLSRVDLAPTWVPRVLQLVIDPKELLGWARERSGKQRARS